LAGEAILRTPEKIFAEAMALPDFWERLKPYLAMADRKILLDMAKDDRVIYVAYVARLEARD